MIKLADAQKIAEQVLAYAREHDLKPLCVSVFDGRGALKTAQSEDEVSLKRAEIAAAKASGALALGMGSRALMKRAEQQPYFIASVTAVVGGALVPVPGGVLIKQAGVVIGAVGVSGDTSDNDELAALAGIKVAGLEADAG